MAVLNSKETSAASSLSGRFPSDWFSSHSFFPLYCKAGIPVKVLCSVLEKGKYLQCPDSFLVSHKDGWPWNGTLREDFSEEENTNESD